MTAPTWSQMATVGRIARVHGLRGQVIVNPETDFPESRFGPGQTVYRAGRGEDAEALCVATLRFHRGRPIVSFEGIDSIEQAEPLAGAELRVPLEALAALPEGTYYQHDLAGCRVETRSGDAVGQVTRVEGEAGTAQLVVSNGTEEVLVPLAADICVSVDVAGKRIVIEPIDGLLDLNRRKPRQGTERAG